MILEIIEGPQTGRRVTVKEGETVSVGRTVRAMTIFAEDPGMSSLHFAVSLSAGSLRMQNLSQTNGTKVNGSRAESTVLKSGDKIRAGATVFTVIGPPENSYPAQVRVGGWGFNIIPQGWKAMDGVGLIHEQETEFRASAAALEDSLPNGKTLRGYIETQVEIAKSQLKNLEIQGPVEAQMEGSDEALLLTVRSDAITQRQIYARSGDVVGILTLSGLPVVNRDFIEIVRGATFHKPQPPS